MTAPAGISTASANTVGDIDRFVTMPDAEFAELFDVMPPPDAPETEAVVDVGPEDVATATDGPEAEADTEADGTDGEAPATPPEPAAVVDAPKLAAQFVLTQAGEEVEFPADMVIAFKASGKEHALPLDRVVRLAQNGFHNEQLVSAHEELTRRLPELEEENGTQADVIQKQRAAMRRLLSDDDYLEQSRERYEALNTPEARAQALADENEHLRSQQDRGRAVERVETFVAQELAPRLESLLAECPDVSPDEIQERYELLAQPLLGRDRILPRQNFAKALRVLEDRVVTWARSEQMRQAELSDARASKQTAATATDKAKATTTTAKRIITRALKPSGPSAAPTAKPRAAPVTMEDAMDVAMREALRGL